MSGTCRFGEGKLPAMREASSVEESKEDRGPDLGEGGQGGAWPLQKQESPHPRAGGIIPARFRKCLEGSEA